MPISVDERNALRSLVQFTVDELAAAGAPTSNLNSLQALTDGRMAEYQATVDAERAAVLALIAADPTGQVHQFWMDAQDGVWERLVLAGIDLLTLYSSTDPRVKQLGKGLPLLASLRWTLTNFQA